MEALKDHKYTGYFILIVILFFIISGISIYTLSVDDYNITTTDITNIDVAGNFTYQNSIDFYDGRGSKVASLFHKVIVNVSSSHFIESIQQVIKFESIRIDTLSEKDIPLISSFSLLFDLAPCIKRRTSSASDSICVSLVIGDPEPALSFTDGQIYRIPPTQINEDFSDFYEASAKISYKGISMNTYFGNTIKIDGGKFSPLNIDLQDLISIEYKPTKISLPDFYTATQGEPNYFALVILVLYTIFIIYLTWLDFISLAKAGHRINYSPKTYFEDLWLSLTGGDFQGRSSLISKTYARSITRALVVYISFITLMVYLILLVTTNYLGAVSSVIINTTALIILSSISIVFEYRINVISKSLPDLKTTFHSSSLNTKLLTAILSLHVVIVSLIFGVAYDELISVLRISPA